MTRLLSSLAAACVVGCLFITADVQAQAGAFQLSPEQQQLLNMLPPAQRQEAMRQLTQFQQQQQQMAARRPAQRDAEGPADPQRRARDDADARDATPDDETIRPDDTLLIEIRTPEDAVPSARAQLLEGRHTVQLDRFGRLSMPGITNVALAGLRDEHAAMRLMAEPALQGMRVTVARLTLQPTGREALRPFGHGMFERPIESFWTPQAMGQPVPSDYVMGPGDAVQLQLFGREFGQHYLIVSREGRLHVPNIGPVTVAGMRYSEMKESLEQRIQEQTIGTRAAVSMGELRSIEVFVLGDVQFPGVYTVSSLATVLHALYESGGITEIGSLRDVRLIRGGELVRRIDLYELLLHGNARDDVRLHDDDVVFVPATGPRVGVIGEVMRPAWYELRQDTTLGDLIDYAAGSARNADLTRVQIERVRADGHQQYLDVDASGPDGRRVAVRNGDVVEVPRLTRPITDAVTLRGHVGAPGARQWREGLRISDLLPDRGVLRENADLDYALLVREQPDGRGVSVRAFAPRDVLADPGGDDDLTLRPRDELLLFGFDDPTGRQALVEPLVERMRRQATQDSGSHVVRVVGAVRAPGYYPWGAGMRVSDLVRAGGGLAESAFLESAEITRFLVRNGAERDTEHVHFPLGPALEGAPGADIALRSNDVLNVKRVPLWAEHGTVELRGEVRFPGVYPIRPGEMISDVIRRAGGLTDEAFPHAAVFTRAVLREREQEQIDQMVRRLEADIATAATRQMDADTAQARAMAQQLLEQLRGTRAAGRLVIDLPRLMRHAGNVDYDVLARGGDLLVVPQRPQEVTVMGEVYFPTSHIYDPELAGNAYLERSGGITYRADARRIYVVRANGAVEPAARGRFARGIARDIQPGDTIVVPVDAERVPMMVRVMNVSQVLYQLGIAAAAWNTLGVF